MPLESGTSLGPYQVTAKIGEGGMGEVYRARDTKLDRDVALKVLPQAFTEDPDRLARFEREAKVLASLNHPNIGHIYGLEEAEGQRALVLELIEGPTLADRIKQGPIPVDEALPIAKQIAEALEAAHEQGVIHRDLKPANVKVKDDGTVKVLDFGLAKAMEGSGGDVSESPTVTAAATAQGVILGTAAYMSPEQASGKPADKRSDIWSFGVVMFEMLSGRRVFEGETVPHVLGAVLQVEPNWDALSASTPEALRRLLRRCLEKDRKRRLRDIGDALIDLEVTTTQSVQADQAVPLLRIWQRPVAVIGAVLLSVVVASLGTWWMTRSVLPPLTVERFSIALDSGQTFRGTTGRRLVSLSTDGTQLVYNANNQLFIRRLDQLTASPIPATAAFSAATGGAMEPFISPDGQWIGFWAEGQIRKVGVNGGSDVKLCDAGIPYGITWADDDTILFAQAPEGILRVSADGGTPEVLIRVADGERARNPQLLAGGEWVLFTLRPAGVTDWDDAQIVLESLASGERIVVIEGGYDARLLPTGHLLYALEDAVLAAPFDLSTRQVTDGSGPVVDGVAHQSFIGTSHFAVSQSGSLAYVPDSAVNDYSPGSLRWVDRQGRTISEVGPENVYGHPRLSPNGSRAAAVVIGDGARGQNSLDVWVLEMEDGRSRRLTDDGISFGPFAWTSAGSALTFASWAPGQEGLFELPADQSGDPALLAGAQMAVPGDWSRDGETLVYWATLNPGDQEIDIWTLSRGGEPTPFLATEYDERAARLSPNGRWVAYVSDQTDDDRVYVQPFPGGGRVVAISTGSGTEPVWARDGRTLFYRDGTQMFEVEVTTESTFAASTPRLLFDQPYDTDPTQVGVPNYDVSIDGERFLMMGGSEATEASITLVQNWTEELKRLVPVD